MEAGIGLGETLVSGRMNADVYRVRDGEVIAKAIATKRLATPCRVWAGPTKSQSSRRNRISRRCRMRRWFGSPSWGGG